MTYYVLRKIIGTIVVINTIIVDNEHKPFHTSKLGYSSWQSMFSSSFFCKKKILILINTSLHILLINQGL